MTMQELIEGSGLNDVEIGAKLAVSAFSVRRWRKGRKVPTPIARKALAKLCGVPLADVAWERTAVRAALERNAKPCPPG